VEAGNVEHKEKRRNRGDLRGANSHWAEDIRGALEDEPTLAFGEDRLDPCYEVGGNPPSRKDTSQPVSTDVIKTIFDVQEEG